jgi:NitT/TauT family transport system ATP-binding protein
VAPVKAAITVDIREKRFAAADGSFRQILRDVAFRIQPGEFAALVGPSGCGKTTLLNIIAGLDENVAGSVRFDGKQLADLRIGYVFQQPRLLPWRTVFENIALVLPHGAAPSAILRLIDEVGLTGSRDVYPHRLSLGMARRVAIARAFAVTPQLLLMDEPFVSLDAAAASRLRALLVDLWRSHPTTVLFVTHDLGEAVELADRILVLSDAPGRFLADIPVPLSREQRSDREAVEGVRADIVARQRRLLAGDAPPRA